MSCLIAILLLCCCNNNRCNDVLGGNDCDNLGCRCGNDCCKICAASLDSGEPYNNVAEINTGNSHLEPLINQHDSFNIPLNQVQNDMFPA